MLYTPNTLKCVRKSILIIDDEYSILDISREILEYAGFKVITSLTGRNGVDLYHQYKEYIGAILLDMNMPFFNGAETLEELKAINPELYVVLTSGSSEEDVSKRCLGSYPTAFLAKPFTPEKLIEIFSVMEEKQ